MVGSPDGIYLGQALAKGSALQWLRMEIGIRGAEVPDLRSQLPEEGQAWRGTSHGQRTGEAVTVNNQGNDDRW